MRIKHICIKYHFIRDCLEDGSIKASHIATTDQLADILTKSLGKSKFQEKREDWATADHLQCLAQGLGGELIVLKHLYLTFPALLLFLASKPSVRNMLSIHFSS
jgi:hypothetical protein